MKKEIHKRYMEYAIRKARQGIKKGQTPFGACIVKSGKVISCAHNIVWKTKNITAHAEIHAIEIACRKLGTVDLSGCIMYSTCEPCPMCFSACHWAKISKIIYGAGITDAKRLGFNELTISNKKMKKLGRSNIELKGNVLKSRALELFKIWSRQEGNSLY